jgi:hypothetical protein
MMEITIFDGRVSAAKFVNDWQGRNGPVDSVITMARAVIIEVDDDVGREMIDELDRLGMNYEEES